MADTTGVEPINEGVKVPCLTFWLRVCMASTTGFEPVRPERPDCLVGSSLEPLE